MILNAIFANSVDPDRTAPLSDQGPHCLPVCKNRFEKSARIFSRRHKQTTFSDAVFLGALRVNVESIHNLGLAKRKCLRAFAKYTDSGSSHACAKSPSMHSVVSNDSDRGQRRSSSDCADAWADLGLRCQQIHGGAHLIISVARSAL